MAATQQRVRELISAATFKVRASKGAKPEDFADVAVFKALACEKQIDDQNRVITFTLSTPAVDRENDTLAIEGWDIGNYKRNPVVLFGHMQQELPVGKSLATWIEAQELLARDEFVTREIYPFADTVYQMLKGGFLNAVSVGFNPMEWMPSRVRDNGYDFLKQELLEHSVVPVPAHPDALMHARSKGIDIAPLKSFAAHMLEGEPNGPRRRLLERLHAQSDPTGRKVFTALTVLRDASDDAVVPPVATTDDEALVVDGAPISESAPETPPVVEETPAAPPANPDPAAVPAEAAPVTEEETPAEEAEETPAQKLQRIVRGHKAAAIAVRGAEVADTIRWNPRLSKAFDIDRQQFDPSSVEEAMVARFCDCELKHIDRHALQISSVRMGQYLSAIDDVIRQSVTGAAWAIEDVRSFDYEGKEMPPTYETIQLNSTRSSSFLIDGARFLSQQRDTDQEQRAVLKVQPTWFGLNLTVYGVRSKGTALQLLDDIHSRLAQFQFLKGEAFALSGEFLPKTSEGANDLFLTPENTKAVERLIELINTRGADLEPRGAVFLGPPGTGKTLSARTIRNRAQASLIWISARDFRYMGSFGSITSAFDLAREIAPCVIVLEDVDNHLHSETVDLLKTEMDGMARSNSGLVTIFTTNFPELFPAALIDRPGRIHDVLAFELPDDAARTRMLERWLPSATEGARAQAVEQTKGDSGAHVRELARFANIILDQQEATSIDLALMAALTKLHEQRDLITQVQTHGSRYRAPEFLTKRRAAVTKAAPVTEIASAEQIAEIMFTAADEETIAAAVQARSLLLESTLRPELEKAIRAELKAGRVLSRANEASLRAILLALDGAIGKLDKSEDVSAATMSSLRECAEGLRAILAQLDKLDEDEDADNRNKAGDTVPPAPGSDDEVVVELEEEAAETAQRALDLEDVGIDGSELKEAIREEMYRLTGNVDLLDGR